MAPQTDHVQPVDGRKKAVRINESVLASMEKTVSNFEQINIDAKHGTQYELEMTAWEAVRAYPKATFFSFMLSLSLVMEGYGRSTFPQGRRTGY